MYHKSEEIGVDYRNIGTVTKQDSFSTKSPRHTLANNTAPDPTDLLISHDPTVLTNNPVAVGESPSLPAMKWQSDEIK